jgi:hypothetical protein
MKTVIGLLFLALVLSLITIGTLFSMLQRPTGAGTSYMKSFSEEHLRRRGNSYAEHRLDHSVDDADDVATAGADGDAIANAIADATTADAAASSTVAATAAARDLSPAAAVPVPDPLAIRAPHKASHRVAIMVVYVGVSLPAWFRAFALSVEGSGDLVKWMIFVTEALSIADTFENIEIIRISRQELYARLTRLDPFPGAARMMEGLITHAPYSLVEFKPCLATIFEVPHLVLAVLYYCIVLYYVVLYCIVLYCIFSISYCKHTYYY